MKREHVLSWDEYFMGLAHLSAMRSKDPSTQVGAVIVDQEHKVVGIGYNGLPIGCSDDEFPWDREGGMLETFSMAAKMLGATVVGCMIATMINFTTTITLNMGNHQTLAIQSIFDEIAPKLLPLLLAFGCFALIRKGKKTTTVMLLLFLLGFVLAFLEGLPMFAPMV